MTIQPDPERTEPKSPVPDPETLNYQWERLVVVAKELPPLFRKHYEEIAVDREHIPLEPDWDKYFSLDFDGHLRILTVRDAGMLVGYYFLVVGPGLHYVTTLYAATDMFYLDPDYRAGWTGYHMFREVEAFCRAMKVKKLFVNEKQHFQRERGGLSVLFKRLGYKVQDIVWAKVLD